MKRLLLFAIIAIVAVSLSIVGCSKDKEQDPIQWKFEVKADKDTISNLALNDIVPVTYVVNRKYNEGATMQYRVNLDKSQGFTIYDNNDNEVKDFGFQNLTSDTLKLKYKGTFQGIHSLSVTFKNSKDERVDKRVTFDYNIKNKNKTFSIEQKAITNLDNIVQGQDVELSFEIKEEAQTQENFQIQFLSFDAADERLQKSKIYLNNNEVQTNKWYSISKDFINKIQLNSFNAGTKKLVYELKNSVYTERKELDINVKNAVISLKNITLKADDIYINEPFKIECEVEKTHPNNKKIEYKTWLSSGNPANFNFLTITYKSLEINDGNLFPLEFKANSAIEYVLNIQVKDEYGNESEVKRISIIVKNNDFTIEQILNTNLENVEQGQEVKIILKAKEDRLSNELFEIQFLGFDTTDSNLQNSKIIFNNEEIQLKKWYTFNKNSDNQLSIKSFKSGSKKLIYQIKNSSITKSKEVDINILPEQFNVKAETPFKKIVPEKPFNFKLIIETKNHNKEVRYFIHSNMKKLIYDNKVYLKGENIHIQFDNEKEKKEIELQGIIDMNTKNSDIIVNNSDNISKSTTPNAVILTPLTINKISLLGKSYFNINDHYVPTGLIRSVFYIGKKTSLKKDEDIQKENIMYKIIFQKEEKNGKGKIEKIEKELSHIDIFETPSPNFTSEEEKHDLEPDYERNNYENVKILYESEWRNDGLAYKDNVSIEIYYKNKKVYEAKDIKGFYKNLLSINPSTNKTYSKNFWNILQSVKVAEDRIFYENYDHISK
ncbi:hypothetical protein [Capnocytophaga sp. oral taxon 878]|uniref:hypothetical protein n=1 Tax=Capnocytophaga sp. oral taxon 878 TaxID=1316596 RepID=UPI000D0253BD|nr:hypothetical protein [Capnocytophaga sp. oral taxon 878]AVM51531.1 hypothetical protein C4H12_13515 [Capnocytophaga sp. oral taxon 878]